MSSRDTAKIRIRTGPGMAYWWVNHKQTRAHEVRGGYLWSPKRNANGARNQTYDNMTIAQPGDIVFSYANGVIGAVGVVMGRASPCPKPPDFGRVGDYWSNDGWLLPVAFTELQASVRPADHIGLIAPLLPDRYSPIQKSGHGNQGVYLAGISIVLGKLLEDLTETKQTFAIEDQILDPVEALDDVSRIQQDVSLPETQRAQLVQARVGQGLFRVGVLSADRRCKVTGVDDQRLLRASHIKPWRDSSNAERLSPDNGVLLSPHIDALFDQELISFEDDGRMILRPDLSREVLRRWSIEPSKRVEPFRAGQASFLAYHRAALANRWRRA